MTKSTRISTPDAELSKSTADIRARNVWSIFRALFPRNCLSRAELGRRIGVSRMAIGEITKEMCDTRILTTTGLDARPGRGKRSTMLAIDTSYWRLIGIDLSQPYVLIGALLDLVGNVSERTEIVHDDSYDSRASDIIALARRLQKQSTSPILGVVITVPGIVDASGTVLLSIRLGWKNLPLQTIVQDALQLPVLAGNTINATLAAEHSNRAFTDNSMLVKIGMGVGAGLYINGEIVRGDSFAAGEIGHITVQTSQANGSECGCGKTGCLETFVSDKSIRARLAAAPERRTEILSEAGQILGQTLAMTVGLLDLRNIYIDGQPDLVGNTFLDALQQVLDHALTSEYRRGPEVCRCQQLPDRPLKGQTLLALPTLLPTVRTHFQVLSNSQ
ncbi:ROK family protein [Mobiluncus mulieris 28-1]|uniref:ROK family protein n=1 Tax=Mobiluncus mulieris TaxID=2052 RepID=UPI0001BE7DEE|nr:ROK family protein [Mobiluncus mulieris]EEZ90558.1 ROK family protein [Mobiluncus mulieris 28-1]NMW61635.1 ROK family protein [Mobiluncus mulieris]